VPRLQPSLAVREATQHYSEISQQCEQKLDDF
jgi:hypothetical protein